MSFDVLTRLLDGLDHSERIAELVAHTRGLSPSEADATSRQLWSGDAHQRRLALHVAWVTRDLRLPWLALEDPSRRVRALGAKLIGLYAEEIPVALLDRLDGLTLDRLLSHVVRHRRAEIAETLVDGLLARERSNEAARLLPVCSVEAILARIDRAWPELLWARLAKHRAELMLARVEGQFSDQPERPDLVWRRFAADVWTNLARHQPEAMAGWIDRFADADTLPQVLDGALPELLRWSPARAIAWLSSRVPWLCARALPGGLARAATRVDDETLAPLCRGLARAHATGLLGQLLARMPHLRRGRLFEAATESLELARIEWPVELLALLPRSLRDRETARMLELSRAQTDGSWRRQLLGLRSIELARPVLEAEGRSAQASDRGEAHAALILSSARSRAGMAQTLGWLIRIRNEQDPVRLAVLSALASVSGRHFDDPEALDAVVAPIFEARDTSHATRAQAARLAKRLLTSHASEPQSPIFQAGLSILERLAGQRGTLDLPRLDHNLPRGAEQAIFAALRPWIEAAKRREQEQHVFKLWSTLGKRAWQVQELGALLGDMIWQGNKGNAIYAAQLWIADPKTRDARVRELVERDRSALYVGAVFQHCHRRRQTLLVERFVSPAPRGRFHDGKVVIIPMVERGFVRWTTALQRQYLELVEAAETEPRRFAQSRAALVKMRARVPLTCVDDLHAALESADVNVQEAALGALVWLDDVRPALPILLDHLGGDRARVAMYAMPQLARLIPRERFVDALAGLLDRPRLKVTVHKEALRLLGQQATPQALQLLREAWAKPLHRDVRIAALHAARSVLSQPESWAILSSAAADRDPDIARALVEVPLLNIAAAYRARYVQVMAKVAHHPSPVPRAVLFGALSSGWSSAAPVEVVGLAARVIGCIDPDDPWRAAARVLAQGTRSSATHSACEELVEGLAGSADLELVPAGEHDRGAHQRLLGVLSLLSADRHPVNALLLERLAQRLLAEPHWWSVGAKLRVTATRNGSLGAVLLELLANAPTPRIARVLELAAGAAAADSARSWSDEDAEAAVDLLIADGARGRLVALAMLARFGARSGWAASWVGRLVSLREDADLDVRSAARELWITDA